MATNLGWCAARILAAVVFCVSGLSVFGAAEGVLEVPLRLRAVVYDPFTEKVYGSATNHLLQIDPRTGEVLNSFFMGTNVTHLSLGAENGLWAAIDGEGAIRRFDLGTLTAEEKLVITTANRPLMDLFASATDRTFVLGSLPTVTGDFSRSIVVRNGAVLPDSVQTVDYVALQGTFAYIGRGNQVVRMAVGPSGIVVAGALGAFGGGPYRILGDHVYCGSGVVFDADTLALLEGFNAGLPAVDPAENEVYYLEAIVPDRPILTRYAHPSLQKIGFGALGHMPSGALSIGAYRKRVAFNSAENLYLVDVLKLMGAADLAQVAVTQVADPATPIPFGTQVNVHITITNRGPGSAGIVITNTVSSGFGTAYTGTISESEPFVFHFGTLPAGQSFTYSVSVLPEEAGFWTNTVTLALTNAAALPGPSVQIVTVPAPSGPVLRMAGIAARDIAYDPATEKLFAAWADIQVIDPTVPRILPRLAFANPSRIEASARTGGVLYAHFVLPGNSVIRRIDATTGAATDFSSVSSSLIDLVVSPVDTNLIAVVTSGGTYVVKDGVSLPNGYAGSGSVAFSQDGTKLFVVNAQDCSLHTFDINASGLAGERTGLNASCSAFDESGGLLYFDSGVVYDAAAGQRLTNGIGLPAPLFVIPRANLTVDTLSRTNGAWVVRRFTGENRTLQRTVALGSEIVSVLQFIAAGENRVAISTSTSGIYVVNLADMEELALNVSMRADGSIVLRFDSVGGALYRIESATQLPAATWTIVRDDIPGTGAVVEEIVTNSNANGAFYRLVRKGNGP